MELTEAEVEKLLVRIAKVFLYNQLCEALNHPGNNHRSASIVNEKTKLSDELWPVNP